MWEMAARAAAELMEGLVAKLPKGFGEALAAAIEKAPARIVAMAIVLYQALGRDLYESIADNAVRIAAKLFLENPQQIEATEKLGRQIGNELATSVSVISITFWSCFVVAVLFLGLPLLYKAIFRRNLRIFVSFSRLRNDVAEQLQAFLEKHRFRVSRLPFNENAEHQTTIQTIVEFLRTSELVVCVPGPSNSFVEHEILAANTIFRPVILLISEKDGTIPDTTDKRYPAFRMEDLVEQGFRPLEAFISFIGGDLRSMWNICAQALRQGSIRQISRAIGLAIAIAIVGLWILCFAAVQLTPAASVARATNPAEAYIASGTHFALLAFCASITALCLIYCLRVLQSQIKQLFAQRRAQLKVMAAEFRRDDWVDLMAELSSGKIIYNAMFDTSPFTHREKSLRVKPA
jgi:hypothetical protein